MSRKQNRRDFIKTGAAVSAGFWAAGGVPVRASSSALEEVRFACIGIGGKGSSDSDDANTNGRVIAVCDIDATELEKAGRKFPEAKQFQDFREMLESVGNSIDAVTVSTPDHTHAVAAAMAMRMGKHCFCQKPLTHSIEEARLLGTLAREAGLVTQMGNQGTALSSLRLSAALIRHGVIGTVREVHVWTNRPVWPQSYGLKVKEVTPPPETVRWDLWLGPAKPRPFSPEIHPFKWRGFWEFGTGALGDMACHTLNMAYMALDLKNPVSVTANNEAHDNVMYPKSSTIEFEFPEYQGRPALKMFWYDGGRMPPEGLLADLPKKDDRTFSSGALLVGENGKFYSPGDYGEEVNHTGVVVNGEFENQRNIQRRLSVDYVRSPGHFVEFTNAIKGEGVPMSNFPDYAGPLTETILLGNLALWSGKKVEWDADRMVAREMSDDIARMVRHEYGNGFTIH